MSNRLKQITTKAKALYKSGKYSKWTDAIKAASKTLTHTVTKKAKVGAVKKKAAPKKKSAPKRKSSLKSLHKDLKSHNVNIKVMSGTNKNFKDYKVYKKHIIDIEVTPAGKKWYIAHGGYIHVPYYAGSLAVAKKFIDRVISIEKCRM
jgi:DNA-binding beta-propeller fold protein YncE